MTYINARTTRFGFVTLVAAVLTAGICSDAVAKAHKGRLHAYRPVSESRAELATQPPGQLGPMRYYGGPKSPMWRVRKKNHPQPPHPRREKNRQTLWGDVHLGV